ncbi:hypothetical protein D8S78_17705 [Natrialba swarupiae]|nr:hypothetical protein [Natrialba swarupiae]
MTFQYEHVSRPVLVCEGGVLGGDRVDGIADRSGTEFTRPLEGGSVDISDTSPCMFEFVFKDVERPVR